MFRETHIPHLTTISDFYRQLQIGLPSGDDFAIMRIEDQPPTKRMEMPLFRCNFYRLVFFTNTGVRFNLPNQQIDISENSIYFAYPGKLESWVTSQKIKGFLVCFTPEFVRMDKTNSSFIKTYPYFDFTAQSLIRLTKNAAHSLKPVLERMISEVMMNRPDTKEMLSFLLHQYLIQVRRIYLETTAKLIPEVQNSHAIFNRFRSVMEDYFAELAKEELTKQISVSLIAKRLHLNASYLNTVIKNLTGKTASTYLNEQTILEAKSYLMHTDLQVAEISYRLGFTNVSYFNRFFKKLTQQTPLQFRKASV